MTEAEMAAETEALLAAELARGRQYMDNPMAVGAPAAWRWGYLPCGCRNDGYGNHIR